ncbi:MAG: methyltransferase [Bacteroidota bacterium]
MSSTTVAPFRFKQFIIKQDQCPMKVGTDGTLLGAWATATTPQHILDIGTGTGLIAIMLGQRFSDTQVEAVEIDETACAQATENMQAAPWADRLQAHSVSIQDFVKTTGRKYDLIVSNPPFFTGGTFSDRQARNEVRHTVKLPHGDLLSAVRNLLSPNGTFALVLPLIEGLRFEELANSYKLYCTRKTEVRPRKENAVNRLLMQFEREEQPTKVDELVLYTENQNERTAAYAALTEDFYL